MTNLGIPVLAELNIRYVPSPWARYFGRALGPCIFLAGTYMLMFRLIPATIAFAFECYYSGTLTKNATALVNLGVVLIGCYVGLIGCLAGTVVSWREPWEGSTYRITTKGILWEVAGDFRVISWQEVRVALFYVPAAGTSESKVSEANNYYRGLRRYYGLFFSLCTPADEQNFLKSFDPSEGNSLPHPPQHFVLFLRKGRLRCYLAPPAIRLLYISFSRFLFLFDYRVFNGYVSSIDGQYITFGLPLSDEGGGYLPGSRERASFIQKHRQERRCFLLRLTECLIHNGFKPVFK